MGGYHMIKSLVKTREKLRKNKKGFTLIELLVVIAILAVLAAILIPVVGGFIGSARKNAATADARSVYSATTTYLAQNTGDFSGGYNATTNGISDANLEQYLGGTPTTWNFKITAIDITYDSTTGTSTVHSVTITEPQTGGTSYTFDGVHIS
ncbi:type II secretion system protein [Ethanoligenens harbinense]|nr:type II secretion system protein [Ethanoligenens harbinense YUAN-3]AYF38155.1 type II secretion system protein [Ethanoligenens harbinense]AYF40900.1 type II secretion system protein [Ethanoligenens harbinense]QCN91732.1 type II secretion system protein [Ethanoligenens harbinense]